MTRSAPPRLLVETREIDPVEDPLAFTDPIRPLVWQRRGEGMVGFGEPVARIAADTDHGGSLGARWRELAANAEVDDPLGIPGTGLVGFGALAFARSSARSSAIVVPEIVVGHRYGRSWLTTVRTKDSPAPKPRATGYGPHWSATLGPGAQSAAGYITAVREGLAAIAAGDVSKVVLARDLAGTVPAGSDLRRLVRALASGYPDTWAFAVDGLIGASPETLITVEDGIVTARVLAGTAARGADPDADTAASLALATSTKDQDEHQFAVHSVLESLRPHTSALRASEQPFTLKLPNVWHLATDVEGRLSDAASALDLVASLHPTAAVAGTPTPRALETIDRLEPFDRGRYAGPVGWIDAAGSGEWAIALRCAQFDPGDPADPIPLTAYAGAGIVAGSDPESELLETRVKFRPIVDALA